jgi:DnaK suppressor protein
MEVNPVSAKRNVRGRMESEGLNSARDWLLDRKRTLWREILADLENDASKEHGNLIDTIKENGDMGLEELRQSNAFALIELKYDELLRIEEALERIEEGEYGRCLDCKRWIAPARLKAVPYAIRCRDCQSRNENGRGGGLDD